MTPGEKKVVNSGSNGAIVNTYKVYKKDGQIIEKKHTSKSTYIPIAREVQVGPAPEADKPAETPVDTPEVQEPEVTPDTGSSDMPAEQPPAEQPPAETPDDTETEVTPPAEQPEEKPAPTPEENKTQAPEDDASETTVTDGEDSITTVE